MSPMEEMLITGWRSFHDYAAREMGYTNQQNLNECLNGAGAFVDFLLGKRPKMNTRYATSETWPT